MKRVAKKSVIGLGALLAAFTVAGVGAAAVSTTQATVAHSAAATQAATLTAHSSRYGKILFDGRGRVLYLFARDRGGRSRCSGACAKAWPPFLTKGAPRTLAGVNAKLLGTTRRGDDGKHRPYGLMVLQIDGDRIAGILGFPDPWLFEQCGLPSEL